MARRVLTGKGKAVRLEGIPEIASRVNHLLKTIGGDQGRVVGTKVKGLCVKCGLVVRDEARDLAPYDENRKEGEHLRDAIFVDGGDPKAADAIVGVNYKIAPHAHWNEFGARGGEMPPTPYMRPAATATRPTVARMMKEGLVQIVEETLP